MKATRFADWHVGHRGDPLLPFWGLDIVTEDTVDHLHVPTVGNPSMHIPTMVGGLPGMEAVASTMMKKQMKKLDIPEVRELIEILGDPGAEMYGCKMAMDMFKREQEDPLPQVKEVISAMDFYDKAAGAHFAIDPWPNPPGPGTLGCGHFFRACSRKG